MRFSATRPLDSSPFERHAMSPSSLLNDVMEAASIPYSTGSIMLLLVAAVVAGLARGFSGFGAALIFVPLASSVIGPKMAAPLLLVIDGIGAVGMVPGAFVKASKRAIALMALGALIGVPTGVFFLFRADPLIVRWGIVITIALFLLFLMSGRRFQGLDRTPVSLGVGLASGFFSGAAQIGGPPAVAYFLGVAMPAATTRANIVLYFAVSGLISATSYWLTGLLEARIFVLALLVGPPYALAIYAGSRAFGKTGDALFRRICFALIAIAVVLSLPVLDTYLR